MLIMLPGMLAIAATWLVLVVAFGGIGLAIQRLVGLKRVNDERAFSAFWLGWASVIALLQVWHLLLPISALPLVIVVVCGVAGFVWNVRRLMPLVRGRPGAKLVLLLVLCLFALWLANRAMAPILHTDAGLYHITAIRWASSFPVVPGLGNLHGRLGFNSSQFLYEAFLGVGPWTGRVQHLANGLLLFALVAQIGVSAARALVRPGTVRAHDLLRLAVLGPALRWCLVYASSTSPDLAVSVLGVVIVVRLCKLLFDERADDERSYDLLVIAVLSSVGIAIKLSFVAMGLSCTLVAVGSYLLRPCAGGRWRSRLAVVVVPVVAACIVLVPWTIHGLILSGYPVYPSTVGALDVDWRVPDARARAEVRWVRSWAREPFRSPDEVLGSWAWLGPWWERTRRSEDIMVPFALLLAGVFAASCGRKPLGVAARPVLLLLVPAGASVAYWFFAAPHPRFAGASLWLLAAIVMFAAFKRWWQARSAPVIAAGALALALLIALAGNWGRGGLLVEPGSDSGFHPIPTIECVEFVTDSGLVLYVPKEGGRCWDAPLPCTPYPRADLRLRRPGSLASGFTVNPPPGEDE